MRFAGWTWVLGRLEINATEPVTTLFDNILKKWGLKGSNKEYIRKISCVSKERVCGRSWASVTVFVLNKWMSVNLLVEDQKHFHNKLQHLICFLRKVSFVDDQTNLITATSRNEYECIRVMLVQPNSNQVSIHCKLNK